MRSIIHVNTYGEFPRQRKSEVDFSVIFRLDLAKGSGHVCLNEHPQNVILCYYRQKSTGNLPSLLLKVRFLWGKLIRSNCERAMPFTKSTLRPDCHWYTKCCVVYASVKYTLNQLDLNWRNLWVCNDGKYYNSWARFFIKFSCQCFR